MSERLFPIEGQRKKLKYKSYSEKSAVSGVSVDSVFTTVSQKESLATKKDEKLLLMTRQNHLSEKVKDFQKQADKYWKMTKNYEAQGLFEVAQMTKDLTESEVQKAKSRNDQIEIIQSMIDKMLLVYSVEVQKKKLWSGEDGEISESKKHE